MLVSEVENKIQKDPRLNSEIFREDIRLVLDYLGLKNTIGNFKKYDQKHSSETPIEWSTFAENIRNPKQPAVVEILCHGKPTGKTTCIDLPGSTKTEAIKKLDTKQYKFERWM